MSRQSKVKRIRKLLKEKTWLMQKNKELYMELKTLKQKTLKYEMTRNL